MSWAQTMYTIQHFYNAFELNERVNVVENKFPIIAAPDEGGNPSEVILDNLSAGTLWLVEEDTE